MWWPMMDYFDLTPKRVIDTFAFSPEEGTDPSLVRRGLFDIWWARDYTNYGKAVNKDFSLTNWPVGEDMYLYVRRDVIAQIWPYGLGEGTVTNPVNNVEVSAC